MSNFSKFLNGIYNYADADNRNNFVRDFFKAAGKKGDIYTSDELIKSICNGKRVLSDTLMDEFPKNPNTQKEILFLQKTLNRLRIKEMLVEFEMDDDEKEDFDALCEAIATQFENFMKYGDSANTTVKSIYESILDSKLKGGKKANEKAVKASTMLFHSSLKSLVILKPYESLTDSRVAIENFLRNIYDVFRTFEANCDHSGKVLYKGVRSKFLKKNPSSSTYLKMVTEPGALPLELEMLVRVVIYDAAPGMDYMLCGNFNYDSSYTPTVLHNSLKNNLKYEINEVPFTEHLYIHLKGETNNLVDDLISLSRDVFDFIKELQKEFNVTSDLGNINKEIFESIRKVMALRFSMVTDGTYYPFKDELEFAPSLNTVFVKKNSVSIELPGERLIDFKDYKFHSNIFVDFVSRITYHLTVILSMHQGDPNSDKEIMVEIITLTADGKMRHFMYPPTCKAKTYRIVRTIAELARSEKIVGFVVGMITVASTVEVVNRQDITSREREKMGEEILTVYAYGKGKTIQFDVPINLIRKCNVDIEKGIFDITDEVMKHVKHPVLVDEKCIFMFAPLFSAIHANEKEGYSLDYFLDLNA